jgi:hypothetical protein
LFLLSDEAAKNFSRNFFNEYILLYHAQKTQGKCFANPVINDLFEKMRFWPVKTSDAGKKIRQIGRLRQNNGVANHLAALTH